jgi:chromate transport protein ChrA
MDEATIAGYLAGYLGTLIAVFLYFLPGLLLFIALVLIVGLLSLLVQPFLFLIHRLHR